MGLGPFGGLCHDAAIRAVELHADGLIVGACRGEPEGFLVFVEDGLWAKQVGAGEAERAVACIIRDAAYDEPERQIAVAGDRGKQQICL